jgi:hypothetical protein
MYLRALKYFMNLPAVYNSPPDLFVNNALFTSHNVLYSVLVFVCYVPRR